MRIINIGMLLVLCLILLLLAGCIVYAVIANQESIEEPETENSQKWSGLTGFTTTYKFVGEFIDTWLEYGFTEIRDIIDYQDTTKLNGSKAAVIAAKTKGLKFIWGVGAHYIAAENWPSFRQAILDAAQWAQDNGVFEFQLGNEEEFHVDGTTMTIAQIIANIKDVATDVQEIFTNGNVSYTLNDSNIDDWITAGKGDIDLLGLNVYRGGTTFNDHWKTAISKFVNAFGDSGYITEFNLSWSNINNYSTDEEVQAEAVTEMIEYIKDSGIERALFYSWHDYPAGLLGCKK